MVLCEVESASCGNGVKLVVWQFAAEDFSRRSTSAEEFVVGIWHVI